MSTIRVMIYDPLDGVKTGGEELISARPVGTDAFIWADLDCVEPGHERDLLVDGFGIAALAVQDAQRERHPPKMEVFDDYVFLLLRELAQADIVDDEPIFTHTTVFVGPGMLITRRSSASPSVDETWKAVTGETLQRGPAHIVYQICRGMVDVYTPVVLSYEARLSDHEDEMFEHPRDAILESLTSLNRVLKKLRRTLSYEHDITSRLARPDVALPVTFDHHEFTDLCENMERLASLCQLNQELAVDLMNSYLSISSHRLNQVMRVLTIVTVMFLPLGLLAGIYGMNFSFMPELGWRAGYFVVLGVMLSIVISLALVFRHKRWL